MLELDVLTRRYGENVALDSLSFNVKRGEVVGFLGPNGAGKTTAMRAILGIVSPDSGEVRWDGKLADLSVRLSFGYMPEERGLYPTMKIIEQLIFLGQLHGMDKSETETAARHWLEIVGLETRGNDRLDSLSMGNQQRIQLVASLIHKPQLLVLDEPFSGLDPTGISTLSEILKERGREGAAVVFSSHQLNLVESLCERVVIIDHGRKVVEGTVDELTQSRDILSVRVDDDLSGNWSNELSGVTVEAVNQGTVRLRLLNASATEVLDAARTHGAVSYFAFDGKRLSEVFHEAVKR